jgi:hypothetical protein
MFGFIGDDVAEVATRWAVLYIAKEHRCQLFDTPDALNEAAQ